MGNLIPVLKVHVAIIFQWSVFLCFVLLFIVYSSTSSFLVIWSLYSFSPFNFHNFHIFDFFCPLRTCYVKSTQKVPKHDHMKKCPSDLENGSLVAVIESILMQKNKTIGSKVTKSRL